MSSVFLGNKKYPYCLCNRGDHLNSRYHSSLY